jgi:NAD(P)H-flavin reductase
MRTCTARVTELRLDAIGQIEARITCPAGAIPWPGQYLQAIDPRETDAALPWAVFPSEIVPGSFVAAAPFPTRWTPGTELNLRGPLGHGFRLPQGARRIALAALGESVARLLPLAAAALSVDASTAIFTNAPLPYVSSALEIYPLAALPEALSWADYLALDIPLQKLSGLRLCLGLGRDQAVTCPAQALILTPMPCATAAECGVCAVPTRGSRKLACQDGPVFNLIEIEW